MTGRLNTETVKDVLEFVKKITGNEYKSYQITPDGKFALGWTSKGIEGWEKFEFEHDLETLAQLICKHISELNYHDSEWDMWDGSTSKGFKVDNIEETFSYENEENIKNPCYGIIVFSPYTNFYSK